ncbi:MAG: hypothetical protein Q8L91_06610 [Polaromonas sp.]|nr:hypothetical protein [Polaromonas sp.]
MMPTPLEALLVYAVVLGCALYCLWVFLPAPLKRRAASRLMRLSPRLVASHRLQKLTRDPGGCGSGCNNCGSAQPPREHKVQLVRRR